MLRRVLFEIIRDNGSERGGLKKALSKHHKE